MMLKHRHHAQGDPRDTVRDIYCNSKRTTARVQFGWWVCDRCGKMLWRDRRGK